MRIENDCNETDLKITLCSLTNNYFNAQLNDLLNNAAKMKKKSFKNEKLISFIVRFNLPISLIDKIEFKDYTTTLNLN